LILKYHSGARLELKPCTVVFLIALYYPLGQLTKDMSVNIIKVANLALSLFLEFCMVVGFAYWGFNTGSSLMAQLFLGIGVPMGVIVVWGIFLAPASTRRLHGRPHWVLEIILFAASISAVFMAGRPTLAGVFAAIYAINVMLRLVWKQ